MGAERPLLVILTSLSQSFPPLTSPFTYYDPQLHPTLLPPLLTSLLNIPLSTTIRSLYFPSPTFPHF